MIGVDVGEYIGVCKGGADLLWCFSVVAIRTKRWTECKATQGGADVLSILPLLPSHKNTLECSDPGGRWCQPPQILQAGFQDVTVTTIRTKDIAAASRLRITS